MDPVYRELLLEMGAPAISVLEDRISGCADSRFDRNLQGWNALYALVAIRETAAPHLATSPLAGKPANLFLLDLIAEVDAPDADHAIAALLATLREGSQEPSPYVARLTQHAPSGGGPRSIEVRPDGRVTLTEPAGDKLRSRSAMLPTEATGAVFAALHTNLFWIQRPLRTSGGPKEDLLRFQLLRGSHSLHEASIWEGEAVTGNRHVGRILKAFRTVEKLGREELTKRQLQR